MKSFSIQRFAAHAVLLAAAFSLSACANKKGSAGAGGTTDYDSVNGTPLPERTDGVSFMGNNVDRNRFSPVYFGFDSYDVSAAEQGKIHQVAEFLRQNHKAVILGGFTDERGTPEYNRGLGERRAQSVRQALIAAGADGGSVQTVSFGSEMPADAGSGESAWAKNRRAEFGITR